MFGSGTCQQWNVGGSRVDVYLVSGRCDVRSSDPYVRFSAGHVSMLSMCHDGGERGTCSGFMLVAPFRVCIIYRCYYNRITAVAYLDSSLQ